MDQILEGISLVLQWENLFLTMFGVAAGMILGCIPGLSANIGIVLLLPFIFYLGPVPGIAMLMGMSKGDGFGGSISAILLNIPGTSHAVVTSFDGYPLTQQGKGGKALETALAASCTADFTSDLILIFLAAPVALMALKIGPPEYTALVLFSVVLIALAATDDPLKGIIAIGLGLLVSTVGLDPEEGTERFAFGILELTDGIPLMPFALGLLAVSELFRQAELVFYKQYAKEVIQQSIALRTGNKADEHLSWAEYKQLIPTIFRSTGIGAAMGILPGVGTSVASYLGYVVAKKRSPTPEKFGKGMLEGVAACEAANNAVNGPNLIPLVTLGIPGNVAAALILGGLMIKGLVPGPTFMETQAPMLYALFTVLLFSNVFTFAFGKVAIRYAHKLTSLPVNLLHGNILILCAMGCYVSYGSEFAFYIMFIFAVLGYIFTRSGLNLPVFLVAFILGGMLEEKLRQSLTISGGDFSIFVTRPISCGFIVLTVGSAIWFLRSSKKKARRH